MPFNPRLRPSLLTSAALIGLLLSGAACTPTKGPRTIRAAQSGAADVIGNDNVALVTCTAMLTLTVGFAPPLL